MKFDEIHLPNGRLNTTKRVWVAAACVLTLLAAFFCVKWVLATRTVQADALWLAPVKRGVLHKSVVGFGELTPETVVDITSRAGGTVESVPVMVGAHVKRDTPLVVLSNPALVQQAANSKRDFVEAKARFLADKYAGQRHVIEAQQQVSDLAQQSTLLDYKIKAQTRLYSKHIISELEYMQTKAKQAGTERALGVARKNASRIETLENSISQQREAALELAEDAVEAMTDQVADLTLCAPDDGVVYQIGDDLTIGSNVQAGQSVLQIIVGDGLIGQLQVAATDAASIRPGLKAELEVAGKSITGNVARVSPKAVQGRVEVRIHLDAERLEGLRAGDQVTGEIQTGLIGSKVYVHAPPNVEPNTTSSVFVQDAKSTDYLTRSMITFGAKVGDHIIVEHGVEPGDHVVLSDMGAYDSEEQLRIVP